MKKRLLALCLVVCLVLGMLPMTAFAADGETIKVTGSTGTLNGTESISWQGTNYQVVNYKDNSSTAIRTNDTAHFRVYVGNEFYVQGKDGAQMAKVVINCVSSYLINNSSNTVNDGWTVSADGTAITYTATSGAADELHISVGKQSRVTSVVITPAAVAGCDHDSLTCGDTCDVCGETIEHEFDNACDDECNICYGWNDNWQDHAYDGVYDAFCNVCGLERNVDYPGADSTLTISEANAIGEGMSHDTTTPAKYYVTGTITEIYNTTYGNMYIVDENGNKLTIYGTYSADGSKRFDAMTEKPEVDMTITVYGVIGNYNGAAQIKNGWVVEMISNCDHEYEYECSTTCALCGNGEREAACESDAEYECLDGDCIYCGKAVAGLGHAYDDQWDPDCNYGCGETREVEERPEITEATIDFSTKDQRTAYSTTAQVWANGGLTVTNNKGNATTNVGDYANPARFYKSSEIVIAFPGMTSLVIDCSNTGDAKYSTPWGDMLTAAGLTYTVDSKVYTVTFAEPVDSITLSASAQVRANSMTATAAKQTEEPACEHEYQYDCSKVCSVCGEETRPEAEHSYFYACDPVCMNCYEITNPDAAHSIVHVEAVEATCTKNGNIEYWYCSDYSPASP